MKKQLILFFTATVTTIAILALAGCDPSTPVMITNRSDITISNIVVTGIIFTNHVASIAPGAGQLLAVRLRGRSGHHVTFDAAGQKVDSGDLGYIDHMLGLSVIIDTNFNVTSSPYH